MKHEVNQYANDWITCKCGKLFSNSKKGRRTAKEKFEEHLLETLNEDNSKKEIREEGKMNKEELEKRVEEIEKDIEVKKGQLHNLNTQTHHQYIQPRLHSH